MAQHKISVLIPTRGRTDALLKSVTSIVERASDPTTIEVLFGFDRDDEVGVNYFKQVVRPYLTEHGVSVAGHLFHPLGYQGLNVYYNSLAEKTDADWFMLFSDDAIIETQGWDEVITHHTGEFTLLKVHTHNEHPFSIFPIYPREWYDLFGFISVHQMVDAELSQIAYMLDIVQIVEINVTHDRYDLTGNNLDATEINRVRLEGNPTDPRDFSHPGQVEHRGRAAAKIAAHLKATGRDVTWWERVITGEQDPWERMFTNDVNAFLAGTLAWRASRDCHQP